MGMLLSCRLSLELIFFNSNIHEGTWISIHEKTDAATRMQLTLEKWTNLATGFLNNICYGAKHGLVLLQNREGGPSANMQSMEPE